METTLSWNASNWITVCLMALSGALLFVFVAQLWHNRSSAAASG